MYCGECGNECEGHAGDDGFSYEYQGIRGYHAQPWVASECCDATLYTDEELRHEYDFRQYENDCAERAAEDKYDSMKDDGLI